MQINKTNTAKFKLSEEELEDVYRFIYLGSIVSNDFGTDRHIKCRTGKAAAVLKT